MRHLVRASVPVSIVLLAAFFRLYRLDSLPPGLYSDEAINGLDIQGIFQGRAPIVFGDREPLFIYLQAVAVALFQQPELPLRLVAALFGIGTVGLTYLLAGKIFDRWTAALSSVGVATSFWVVDINRLGLRANTLPFFAMLSFYFLWVGLGRGKKGGNLTVQLLWPYVLAGFFLGISLYTYLAARLLPLIFVLILGWLVLCRALAWRRGLLILSTVGIVAAVAYIPLGSHLLNNPDVFFFHSGETSFFGTGTGKYSGPVSFLIHISNTLGMFTFHGDYNWRHNIAFRPVFDPVSSVFFITGLLYALYRFRSREYSFVVMWLFVMLLPGILSIESPHFLRTFAAAPSAYILAAVGFVQVARWLRGAVSRFHLNCARANGVYAVAVAGLVLAAGINTYRDYFETWATSPEVYHAFESEVTASARFLNTLRGEPLVLASATLVPHPTHMYLSRPFANLLWYDSRRALVLPGSDLPRQPSPASTAANPAASEAVFILYGDRNPWLATLDKVFPEGSVIFEGQRPDGVTAFSAFRVPDMARTGAAIEPPSPLRVNFDELVQLVGYGVQGTGVRGNISTVRPGETLGLSLYWKPLKPAGQPNLAFFTHLTDLRFTNWGQDDNIGYDSSQWRGGELVITRFDIGVRQDTPPGRYALRIGLYSRKTMDRLPISDSAGRSLGDALSLTPVKVVSSKDEAPKPQREMSTVFDRKAQLVGYDIATAQKSVGAETSGPLRPGEKLRITLYWKGLGAMKEDYTIFLHLTKPSGEPVAQADSQPASGAFPTSFWDEGEFIADAHEIAIPTGLPPGDYRLEAGMYRLQSGERLLADTGSDSVRLGAITVK